MKERHDPLKLKLCLECCAEFIGTYRTQICSDACREVRARWKNREAARRWEWKYRFKRSAYYRDYHQRNRDKRNAKSRAYWRKNRERFAAERRVQALSPDVRRINNLVNQKSYWKHRERRLAKRRAARKAQQQSMAA